MSASEGPRSARLNPFAFPSDTAFRFLLLSLAVVGASMFAFNWLYWSTHDAAAEARTEMACAIRAGPVLAGLDAPAAAARRAARLDACMADIDHAKAVWILAGVGLLLLAAAALYLLWPRWIIRRKRLVPLTAADAPEVVAYLHDLCRDCGIASPPRFVWSPLAMWSGGLAFGRVGARYVSLTGGLVATFYTDRGAFRAVVLHELGHLRNRDVDRTYLTMAVWYAFVALAVVPLVPTLLDERGGAVRSIGLRLLALAVLVYLTRNAVLRVREVYADARAAGAAGGSGGLRRMIENTRGADRGPWRWLLRVHPHPRDRIAALDDADRLFRPGLWEALVAGIVLTLVYHQLVTLLSFLTSSATTTVWLAALAVAPFAGAVVVVGVWRDAFRALARGAPPQRAWAQGLAFAAGFLAGDVLSLERVGGGAGGPAAALQAVTQLPEVRPVVSSAALGTGVIWVALPVAGLVLFAAWARATAIVWLERGGERTPRVALAGVIAAGGAVLTVATGMFFLVHDIVAPILPATARLTRELHGQVAAVTAAGPEAPFRLVMDPTGAYLGSRWPVIPVFVLLWAVPLAAALVRRRPQPSWGSLDGRLELGEAGPMALRRALLVGAAAGAAVWVAVLALRLGIHVTVDPDHRSSLGFLLAYQYWQLALAIAAQPVAAAVAVVVCERHRVVHGLFAAFVAGVLGAAAILAGVTVGSCAGPFSLVAGAGCPKVVDGAFAHQVLDQVLALGSALALIVALVAAEAAGLARSARTSGPRQAPRPASS